MEKLLTKKMAAELAEVHPATIKNWMNRGLLGVEMRVGTHPLFLEKDVRLAAKLARNEAGDGRPRRGDVKRRVLIFK